MREILFRGKRTHDDEWIVGSLHIDKFENDKEYLCCEINQCDVYPETVGQYTGLTDKNGKKIFEGDIVKIESQLYGSPFWDAKIGKVVYNECSYFVEPENPIMSEYLFADECAEFEVIGNIHDNSELLKGGAE